VIGGAGQAERSDLLAAALVDWNACADTDSGRNIGGRPNTQDKLLRMYSATGTRPRPNSYQSFLHDLQERTGVSQLARTGDQSLRNSII
jgi:hypothetical protein